MRYDLMPATPDLSAFPRGRWVRAYRDALSHLVDDDLGYREPFGVQRLREALVEYLGRVRGVVAAAEQVVVTSGFAQARGVDRTGPVPDGVRTWVEDTGTANGRRSSVPTWRSSRFRLIDEGMQVEQLAERGVDAVS